MSEHCKDHLCLKGKVDELTSNKRFWNRIFSSKYSHFLITGIIILTCMFVGWTVNEIYAQKANEKENKKTSEIICQDMKEIKNEVKKINDKREKDKEDIMNKLLEIQKQIKK